MNRKNLPSLIGIVSTAMAIAGGVLVLVGYFFPTNKAGGVSLLSEIRLELINWAIVLAGFAVFVGIINLFQVHFRKIQTRQKGSFYSMILLVSLAVTLLFALASPGQARVVVTTIQIPVEASLMGLLAVTLTYASARLLHRKFNLLSVIFLVTALLILLGTAPLPFVGDIPVLSDFVRPYIAQVLAAGGARGILIGVALGVLTTGIRVLFGANRPYEGNG